MLFIRGPLSLYTLRFLLGAAEAGFFPGMVYYLWVYSKDRAAASRADFWGSRLRRWPAPRWRFGSAARAYCAPLPDAAGAHSSAGLSRGTDERGPPCSNTQSTPRAVIASIPFSSR